MTISAILEQVKTLSPQERKELAKLLIDMMDVPQQGHQPKTGADIVAMLEAMDGPIERVDSHIEDPVEWVKAQRRKRQDKLKPYWDAEE
ncbi:MAG: hypothetical protein OZ934_08420 [Anaerolineae bacterium]|nr:hypothetical protein [Anaerolineae bacterium]